MNSEGILRFSEYKDEYKESCIRAFQSNIPDYFAAHELQEFEQLLTRIIAEGNDANYTVVFLDDQIIGCGGYGKRTDSDEITLIWGMIDKAYHKKGYGKAFFEYRLEKIKETYSCDKVVIDTTQFSYGFFEKYGFKTVLITPDYYAPGFDRYDMDLKIDRASAH
jgi:N-acetylglutamate synthase-like GNAT family acetyltransferase